MYNSLDPMKERRAIIGSVEVNYNDVITQKEFMFELEGLESTHVIIDRVQEVL